MARSATIMPHVEQQCVRPARGSLGWSRPRQNYPRATAGSAVVAFHNYKDERRTEIDMRSRSSGVVSIATLCLIFQMISSNSLRVSCRYIT